MKPLVLTRKMENGELIRWLFVAICILFIACEARAEDTPWSRPDRILSASTSPQVLWTYDDPDAVPMEMAMDGSGEILWVGQGLNYARAQLFDMDHDRPLWEYCFTKGIWENHVCVDIPEDGSLLPALGRLTGNLVVFDPQAAYPHIPIFEHSLGPNRWGAWVRISRDGSTIVACGHATEDTMVVVVLDGTVRPPELLWKLVKKGQRWEGIEGIDMTDDGSTIVVSTYYRLLILHRSEPTIVQAIDNWGEVRAVVSRDGRYIAAGDFNGDVSLYLREDISGLYDLLWSHSEGEGIWITSLAISRDGGTIAAGTFDYYDMARSSLLLFYSGDDEPLWRYETFGDRVTGIDLSDDGFWIAASSWGDLENNLNDLAVFDLAGSIPQFALSSPGSFYCCQMSADGLKVAGGSKMVHARVMGRGGTVWSIALEEAGQEYEVDYPGGALCGLWPSPNPTSGPCSIRWSVPQAGSLPLDLRLYDVTGRVIRMLGAFDRSTGEVAWNGLDEVGNPVSSGIYFCYLSGRDWSARSKLVVTR